MMQKISNAPNHQTTKDNPTQEERFTEIRIVSVFSCEVLSWSNWTPTVCKGSAEKSCFLNCCQFQAFLAQGDESWRVALVPTSRLSLRIFGTTGWVLRTPPSLSEASLGLDPPAGLNWPNTPPPHNGLATALNVWTTNYLQPATSYKPCAKIYMYSLSHRKKRQILLQKTCQPRSVGQEGLLCNLSSDS